MNIIETSWGKFTVNKSLYEAISVNNPEILVEVNKEKVDDRRKLKSTIKQQMANDAKYVDVKDANELKTYKDLLISELEDTKFGSAMGKSELSRWVGKYVDKFAQKNLTPEAPKDIGIGAFVSADGLDDATIGILCNNIKQLVPEKYRDEIGNRFNQQAITAMRQQNTQDNEEIRRMLADIDSISVSSTAINKLRKEINDVEQLSYSLRNYIKKIMKSRLGLWGGNVSSGDLTYATDGTYDEIDDADKNAEQQEKEEQQEQQKQQEKEARHKELSRLKDRHQLRSLNIYNSDDEITNELNRQEAVKKKQTERGEQEQAYIQAQKKEEKEIQKMLDRGASEEQIAAVLGYRDVQSQVATDNKKADSFTGYDVLPDYIGKAKKKGSGENSVASGYLQQALGGYLMMPIGRGGFFHGIPADLRGLALRYIGLDIDIAHSQLNKVLKMAMKGFYDLESSEEIKSKTNMDAIKKVAESFLNNITYTVRFNKSKDLSQFVQVLNMDPRIRAHFETRENADLRFENAKRSVYIFRDRKEKRPVLVLILEPQFEVAKKFLSGVGKWFQGMDSIK